MGTSETFHFERADVEMNPEAISAEILKILKKTFFENILILILLVL